jgi:putative peptide zinc metalloprotease protein
MSDTSLVVVRSTPGVRLEPFDAADAFRVIYTDAGRYFRVQPAEAEVIQALVDGPRSLSEFDTLASSAVGADRARALLAKLIQLDLAVCADAPSVAEAAVAESAEEDAHGATPRGLRGWFFSRLTIDSPLSARFSFLMPDRWLDRNPAVVKLVAGLGTRVVAGAVVLLAIVLEAAHWRVPFPHVFLTKTDLVVAATWTYPVLFLHEVAHACVLKYRGGKVRGMGVILLYFSPGLYCDASDAWRFRNRWHRVEVAMAGIVVHSVAAGAAIVAFRLGTPRPSLIVFAQLNLFIAVANAVPFSRFDGYWVMASALDIPNLRQKSTRAARSGLATLFVGAPRVTEAGPNVRALWAFAAGHLGVLVLLLTATIAEGPSLTRRYVGGAAPLLWVAAGFWVAHHLWSQRHTAASAWRATVARSRHTPAIAYLRAASLTLVLLGTWSAVVAAIR